MVKPLLSTFEITEQYTGKVVKIVRGKWGSVFNYHPEYPVPKYYYKLVEPTTEPSEENEEGI